MKNSAQARSSIAKRLDDADARAWARFRHKLQEVNSYSAAQTLADAVPLRARVRERTLHLHLGRYIQTREVPEEAEPEEGRELELLLLRLSLSHAT